METYLTIKSVLMAIALIGAFGLFFVRVRHLVIIMQSVNGKSETKPDRIGERIKVMFTDIIGQSNVRRKLMPGIAHTLIFFGFLAVQPHSLELMVQGVFPNFSAAHVAPGIYGAYLAIADFLAFFVLIGLGYALFRRVFLKPVYLTDGSDARMIIFFTSVIILSFHFINAFQISIPNTHDFNYAEYFSISAIIGSIMNTGSMSMTDRLTGYEFSYWIHMLTIMGFLIYIPGSKHLHLLAAVPNVFLKPLEREKAMTKTDIEDEDAESFGLGRVSDLNWKNVLDLYSCTECGRCEEQCPANATDKPLSPKKFIHDAKIDLFNHADAVIEKNEDDIMPIVRDDSGITKDTIWSCTSCRACEDICPVDIQHLDIILEARKYQVLMEADFPEEMQETFTNIENQSNPWGFSADTRADWAKGMDIPLMTDHPEPELLYFVGCAGSFDDRGKKIAQAIARVLKKADVDFSILGPEEMCNGDLARRCGNEYLAQMMIAGNVETLNQYRPKKILTGCPHCFNMMKNEYPQFGASFEVVHHAEYMFDLLKQGRITTNGRGFGEISFHDSCYLGRWNGIYEAPRELIRSMNRGAKIVEMPKIRDKGMCCGAGGARMFMEETIGERINNVRAKEAIDTRADLVSAACPFCITMLADGITDAGSKMAVKDLAEIVDEATS